MNKNKVIAITMGDPSGVGPEIILKSFLDARLGEKGKAVVVGDYAVLKKVRNRLDVEVDIKRISAPEEAFHMPKAVPVLDLMIIPDANALRVGEVSPSGGKAAVEYIRKAVTLALSGKVKGISTAPISKQAIRQAGFNYIDHTEMLSEMCGRKKVITMFMVNRLKIFFHSRHLSLREATGVLTVDSVFETIVSADRCMRSLGYKKYLLALAALNPHASDGGMFGKEEESILVPACAKARESGIQIEGPIPADSVFHLGLKGKYDAVISLYHDQGHIAAKTYNFLQTVSVTLGLPFIRTSVDHGTAFDIAWKGIISPLSMTEAILACFELSERYSPVDL